MKMGKLATETYDLYKTTGFRNTFKLARKHGISLWAAVLSLSTVTASFILFVWSSLESFFYKGDFWLFYALTFVGMIFFVDAFNTLSFRVQRMEPELFWSSRDQISFNSPSNAIVAFKSKFKEFEISKQEVALAELKDYLAQKTFIERNGVLIGATSILIIPALMLRYENEIKTNDIVFFGIITFALLFGFFGKFAMRYFGWKRLVVSAIIRNLENRA